MAGSLSPPAPDVKLDDGDSDDNSGTSYRIGTDRLQNSVKQVLCMYFSIMYCIQAYKQGLQNLYM